MEYNGNMIQRKSKMIAYDVPFSALFYVIYAGMPEEHLIGRIKEDEDQLIAKLREAYEEGYD